ACCIDIALKPLGQVTLDGAGAPAFPASVVALGCTASDSRHAQSGLEKTLDRRITLRLLIPDLTLLILDEKPLIRPGQFELRIETKPCRNPAVECRLDTDESLAVTLATSDPLATWV